MVLKEKVLEKLGKPQHNQPQLPVISNQEAITAQSKLNELLKRFDISTNAQPSNEGKLLTILVHGYMSSKWLWIDPYFGTFGWLRDYQNDPKPRSYGWHSSPPPSHMYVPFDVSVSPLVFPEGLFTTLMREDYEVLTFSQKDPSGDIDLAAKELETILLGIQKIYGKRRLILMGHSRGGICIRRYLDLVNEQQVEKVITLASPHYGTNLTNIKIIKEPAAKILNEARVKKVWDVLGKREVQDLSYEQMAINSEYLQNLNDRAKHPEIEYISAGGTSSTFAHIYTWSISKKFTRKSIWNIFSIQKENSRESEKKKEGQSKQKSRKEKQYHWIAKPNKLLTIFNSNLIPELAFGDGLVTFESSILKDATRKYKINANHEEMAVSNDVKKLILKELKFSLKKH